MEEINENRNSIKIIYNNLIPFGRFTALTVLAWLFVKRPAGVTPRLLNHEKIHVRQQLEIAVACLLLGIALIVWTGASWWWLLTCLPAPFVVYGLSVGIEVLLPPYNQAYRNSCFETEALYNEHSPDYARRWWRHLFAWVHYISNRKYPYLQHHRRPPMQEG